MKLRRVKYIAGNFLLAQFCKVPDRFHIQQNCQNSRKSEKRMLPFQTSYTYSQMIFVHSLLPLFLLCSETCSTKFSLLTENQRLLLSYICVRNEYILHYIYIYAYINSHHKIKIFLGIRVRMQNTQSSASNKSFIIYQFCLNVATYNFH